MSVDIDVLHTLHNRQNHLENIFKNGVHTEDVERLIIYINYSISLIDNEFSKGSVEFFEEKNELNSLRDTFYQFKSRLENIQKNGSFEHKDEHEQKSTTYEIHEKKVNTGSNKTDGDTIIAKLFTILGIVGVIAACVTFFYAYWNTFSDGLKLLLVDVLGLGLMFTGYKLSKKTGDVFYHSIICTGVAILHVGIAFIFTMGYDCIFDADKWRYFIFGAISCFAVAGVSLLTARKLKSKLLTVATMIGLYVSAFFVYAYFSIPVGMVIIAPTVIFVMYYLYKSNDIALGITAHILNIINVLYICSWSIDESWRIERAETVLSYDLFTCEIIYCCAYALLLLHIIIPCIRGIKKNESLRVTDVCLMTLNTIIVCICTVMDIDSFVASSVILTLITSASILAVTYFLNTRGLITNGKSDMLILQSIFLVALLPLCSIRDYTCLIWICLTLLALYLWDLTDKNVFKYTSACLMLVFIFAHGVCDLSVSYDEVKSFWNENGKHITQLLSCVVYVYTAYLLRKKNSGVGLQICYTISLFSLGYVASQFCELAENSLNVDAEVFRLERGLYFSDVISYVVSFVFSCFVLFLAKLTDLKKNKIVSGITIAVSGVITSLMLVLTLFCDFFGVYSFLHNESIATADNILFAFLVNTCTLTGITVIFTYLFMLAINSMSKEVITERVRRFILTVVISLSLVSHIISLLDANALYGFVACIILGAVWVLQGFKLHFKGMRYTGLGVVSIFLVRVLFGMNEVPDDIKPILYILIALSCFGVGWVYTYLSKREKNEEACIDD